MSEHGTPARAQLHRNHGEKPCDPCRLAWNAYNRGNRRTRDSDRGRKAMRILRDRHRPEYLAILHELKQADDETR